MCPPRWRRGVSFKECEGKKREAEGAGRKCKLDLLPYLVRIDLVKRKML